MEKIEGEKLKLSFRWCVGVRAIDLEKMCYCFLHMVAYLFSNMCPNEKSIVATTLGNTFVRLQLRIWSG